MKWSLKMVGAPDALDKEFRRVRNMPFMVADLIRFYLSAADGAMLVETTGEMTPLNELSVTITIKRDGGVADGAHR